MKETRDPYGECYRGVEMGHGLSEQRSDVGGGLKVGYAEAGSVCHIRKDWTEPKLE